MTFRLKGLVFLVLSSVLFTYLFEWDRYHILTNYHVHTLSILDKVLVFWLLVVKSLVWCIPVLFVCNLLIAFGLRSTVVPVFLFLSTVTFYFMAVDLVSVGFTGYHAWDYVPHLRDISWQWIEGRLTKDTVTIFSIFAISGAACFAFVGWITTRPRSAFALMRSRRSPAILTAVSFFIVLGVVPALAFFSDRNVLARVLTAVPLATTLVESFRSLTTAGRGGAELAHAGSLSASVSAFGNSQNLPETHGVSNGTDGFGSTDPVRVAMKFAQEAANPGPADLSAVVARPNLPNVILVIFESFRFSAIGPELMGELDRWSRKGLRLQRHYSGSNCSHLGLFPLFYGRSSLGYYQTLDRKVPPQLLESLRRSGYRVTFLTSGETRGFRRLDDFFNDTYCDQIVEEPVFTFNGAKDWPDADRRKLVRLTTLVAPPQDQPQFVFFYLMASHFSYTFPPEFEIFKEAPGFWQFLNPWEQIRGHSKRYANSLLFLEHELMQALGSMDPERNLVIVTGDHGESMAEDGVFRHASRMSEIQLRVPCVMVGAGMESRTIRTASSHADITPTLLHALAGKRVGVHNCQGRDLLASPGPADEVVLAPANGPEWEGLLFIRGNSRMVFNTRTFSQVPSVEFAGLVDEFGQPVPFSSP